MSHHHTAAALNGRAMEGHLGQHQPLIANTEDVEEGLYFDEPPATELKPIQFQDKPGCSNASTSTLCKSDEEYDEPRLKHKVKNKATTIISSILFLIFGLLLSLAILYRHGTLSRSSAGDLSASTDIARFFTPHGITPASWKDTANPVNCVMDWVVRENIHPRSSKWVDWETLHPLSGCPVYPIPDGGVLFHTYWDGPWRPFNDVPIEGFLATQRLGDGHKFIYWYGSVAPPTELRARWSQYSKYVEFRHFNKTLEAQGTCLEEMPEYYDAEYQAAMGMPLVTQSDIIRTLLLAKYGGVWFDSDTIPLKDLTPLLRAGPSVPYSFNNHFLIYGPKEGGVGQKVLDTVCTMSYNETKFHETYPDIQIGMLSWLYNDALSRICELPSVACGLARNPIWFLDGLFSGWLGPGQESLDDIRCQDVGEQDVDSMSTVPAAFRTLWVVHMRLHHRDDSCLEEGANTVAMQMRRRMREMISRGLDMNGRDVYPGPGYMK